MRWVQAGMTFLLFALACTNPAERQVCDGVDEGALAVCNGEEEQAICGGLVRCTYAPDGRIAGRTYDSALCVMGVDELEANCEHVCTRLVELPCAE